MNVFEFPIPTRGSQPIGITQGPDGAVWFAEFNADKIARLDVQSGGRPAAPAPPGNKVGDVSFAAEEAR